MMIVVYKMDKRGTMRCFSAHDMQPSLLGHYALTVSTTVGERGGEERMKLFDNPLEGQEWLLATLASKRKSGYKTLYSWHSGKSLVPQLDRWFSRRVG